MRPYYQDDYVTIYHGDAREILPQLPKVDLVLTDPPYAFGRFDTDTLAGFEAACQGLRICHDQLLNPGGSMFVFCPPNERLFDLYTYIAKPKRVLWMYKPNDCTYPLKGWLLKSEAILWFHNGHPLTLCERKPFKHDCYIVTSVGHEGVEGHPAVKPYRVVLDFASRCPTLGTILDPFMGSGTTLRAAKDLGRKAIGIEIEEKYCEIAAKRMSQEVLAL